MCSRSDAKCSIIELESKFLVARGRDLDLLPTLPSFRKPDALMGTFARKVPLTAVTVWIARSSFSG